MKRVREPRMGTTKPPPHCGCYCKSKTGSTRAIVATTTVATASVTVMTATRAVPIATITTSVTSATNKKKSL